MTEALPNMDQEREILQMDRWPVLVVYSPPNFSEQDLRNHLGQLGKVYDSRKEPYALVIDARSGRRPSALDRKIQSEFREQYDAHVKEYCRGLAIVTNSEILKGVTTAMFWIKKPATSTKFFTDLDQAIGWSEEQLKS
jgi:hypothetical protein